MEREWKQCEENEHFLVNFTANNINTECKHCNQTYWGTYHNGKPIINISYKKNLDTHIKEKHPELVEEWEDSLTEYSYMYNKQNHKSQVRCHICKETLGEINTHGQALKLVNNHTCPTKEKEWSYGDAVEGLEYIEKSGYEHVYKCQLCFGYLRVHCNGDLEGNHDYLKSHHAECLEKQRGVVSEIDVPLKIELNTSLTPPAFKRGDEMEGWKILYHKVEDTTRYRCKSCGKHVISFSDGDCYDEVDEKSKPLKSSWVKEKKLHTTLKDHLASHEEKEARGIYREQVIEEAHLAFNPPPVTERVLTREAQIDRDNFNAGYENGCCSCHIIAPCGFCTDEGNPLNQEEDEKCWEPQAIKSSHNTDPLIVTAPNRNDVVEDPFITISREEYNKLLEYKKEHEQRATEQSKKYDYPTKSCLMINDKEV